MWFVLLSVLASLPGVASGEQSRARSIPKARFLEPKLLKPACSART